MHQHRRRQHVADLAWNGTGQERGMALQGLPVDELSSTASGRGRTQTDVVTCSSIRARIKSCGVIGHVMCSYTTSIGPGITS